MDVNDKFLKSVTYSLQLYEKSRSVVYALAPCEIVCTTRLSSFIIETTTSNTSPFSSKNKHLILQL